MSENQPRFPFEIPNRRTFSPKEISDIVGVSLSTVGRWLDEYKDTFGHSGLRFLQPSGPCGSRIISRNDLVGFLSREPWQAAQQSLFPNVS